MIKLYSNNEIDKDLVKKMYKILINNLFITYPSFLKEKAKHDNDENFDKWYSSIKNTDSYNVITYSIDNDVVAFLSFAMIDKNLWISEVQILDKYKKKGILKELIKEFVMIIKDNDYKTIYIHINKDNKHSKQVFNHIGFIEKENTIYTININELIKWLEK